MKFTALETEFAGDFGDPSIDPAREEVGPDAVKATDTLPPWKDALDLIANPAPLPPELIAGILHQGSKLVLGGASKSNKTWTLLDMAVSVATGSPWWGFPTVQGRVLYLNLEIAEPFFTRRIKAVADAKQSIGARGNLSVWNLRGQSCDAVKFMAGMIPQVRGEGFSLIVLDPVYKLLGGRDENKAGDIAAMLNEIERLAVESGAAVAFGAHFSKGNQAAKESIDRIGGSGVFARDPDSILTLTRHETEDSFVCEPVLRNHPPCAPFVMRWTWPLMWRDDTLDATRLKKPNTGREASFEVAAVVDLLKDKPLRSGEFEALACEKMSRATFFRLRNRAVAKGLIAKNPSHQFQIVSEVSEPFLRHSETVQPVISLTIRSSETETKTEDTGNNCAVRQTRKEHGKTARKRSLTGGKKRKLPRQKSN